MQVFGSLGQGANHFVTPGTHSKWITTKGDRIVRYATYVTGEVFAALKNHPQVELFTYPGRDHAFARVGGEHYDAADAATAGQRAAFHHTGNGREPLRQIGSRIGLINRHFPPLWRTYGRLATVAWAGWRALAFNTARHVSVRFTQAAEQYAIVWRRRAEWSDGLSRRM